MSKSSYPRSSKKKGREDSSGSTVAAAAQEVYEGYATEAGVAKFFAAAGVSKDKTLEIMKRLHMRKVVPCPLGCNHPYLLGTQSLEKKKEILLKNLLCAKCRKTNKPTMW